MICARGEADVVEQLVRAFPSFALSGAGLRQRELDVATGEQIAMLLDRVNADGTALVIVTHDQTLAARSARVLTMRDGRIERETTR